MKNIVYFIFDTPPLESYYTRFGMDYLGKNEWDVHVIDLSPIIYPIAYRIVTTGLIKDVKREIFYSKREYKKYAKGMQENAFIIFTTDFIYDIYFVYKYMKKGQYYGYLTRMDTNVEPDKIGTKERIKGLFNKDFLRHIRNSIFIRIPRKLLPIQAADFLFLGGLANKDDYISLGYTDHHTRICHIHSMDYEVYLKTKEKNEKIISGDYYVFLDEYLPYHPDNETVGYYINPEKYYEEVNCFLEKIKNKYGCRVIVALHPRANMEISKQKYSSDFELRRFETAELIKDCKFVVAHFSTAISYAALFYKPLILFLTDDLMKYAEWRDMSDKYSKMFGTAIYNASDSDNIDLPDSLDINRNRYDEFIRQYVKADYPSKDEHLGKRLHEEFIDLIGEK